MTIEKLRFQKTDIIVVEGVTKPGATIVVENKSIAPFAPNDTPDAFMRAKAGPDGKFRIELPGAHEGDQLQLRAESRGETLSAINVRLSEVAPVDGRIAVVRQQGLRLVPAPGGRFKFAFVSKSTVIGEPDQALQIKNKRSGDKVMFTLDNNGRLPANARIHGDARRQLRARDQRRRSQQRFQLHVRAAGRAGEG
jgi:hypothetical protein